MDYGWDEVKKMNENKINNSTQPKIEGVCIYHGKGYEIAMLIIGTYNELALHLVEEHPEIWLQVQEAHGIKIKK